jgi:hypothetical protein
MRQNDSQRPLSTCLTKDEYRRALERTGAFSSPLGRRKRFRPTAGMVTGTPYGHRAGVYVALGRTKQRKKGRTVLSQALRSVSFRATLRASCAPYGKEQVSFSPTAFPDWSEMGFFALTLSPKGSSSDGT